MGAWKIIGAVALLAAASGAVAGSGEASRARPELSMELRGTIDIRPDGSVAGFTLEDAGKVPPAVASLVDRKVLQWKFESVQADGKPTAVRTQGVLRIVAKPQQDGGYAAGIQSARFSGGAAKNDPSRLSVREKNPPLAYPSFGLLRGMSGDVYVALKLGPDGKVIDGIVQKVNLTASATEAQMAKARRILADSTLEAVRNWTYNVPTQGEEAGLPYWIGVLPVIFDSDGDAPSYGEWRAYLPGPCTEVPWPDPKDGARKPTCDSGPEGVMPLGSDGPKLLTPLMD
jgi:hypothetical protein